MSGCRGPGNLPLAARSAGAVVGMVACGRANGRGRVADEDIILTAIRGGRLRVDSTTGRVWRPDGHPAEVRVAKGYLQVRLQIAGHRARAMAHRIIYRFTRGPIPPGLTINHRNGTKDDNRPENLETATHREQLMHAQAVLGWIPKTEHLRLYRGRPKLTREQVLAIRERVATGAAQAGVAADFGVHRETVRRIVVGARWAYLP